MMIQKAITWRENKRSLQVIACFFLTCFFVFSSCKNKIDNPPSVDVVSEQDSLPIEPKLETQSISNTFVDGSTIATRFPSPQGFARQEIDAKSFGSYLRNFPLLPPNSQVYLYNGRLKGNQSAHTAVLDIDVGDRDLQQCADAVMRLRAEYLFGQKRYKDIKFNFTNGWPFEYSKWREGNDLVVNGNNTSWKLGARPKESYKDFRTYMNWVFMYAGTLSLSKELDKKKIENMEIGDVFVFGGSPGHAVLVVDIAINKSSNDKAFMLAQSYMPAQQIHILKNPMNDDLSPWYLLSEIDAELITPEWKFFYNALMTF